MFVTRIVVAVLAAAVLAGCAAGDTTRDGERIGGTGSVRDDTSPAASGSVTELATGRALLRAGDLPGGYVTLDRQVVTTSDRYWGGSWDDDDGWGDVVGDVRPERAAREHDGSVHVGSPWSPRAAGRLHR